MRRLIAQILRWQAKRVILKNKPTIVVVAGSVGKTSTTQAIATVLSERFRIRQTIANYNTDIGVPCSIFARKFPDSLKNPLSWIKLILKNEVEVHKKQSYSVLILEIGTDKPGEIEEFSWLAPDIAVVTAVAPEHMESFEDIDAVAREELSVSEYSKKIIVNKMTVDKIYLKYVNSEELYNYSRADIKRVNLKAEDLNVFGEHSIDGVAASLAVGKVLGMDINSLRQGAKKVLPQPGRMSILSGIKGSKLIDDTYNASPDAVIAALDYLYSIQHVQRIALLGNMNELGSFSARAHRQIGEYCDLVVTLGEDANKYTANVAKKRGCPVAEATSPYQAADIIKRQLQEGGCVLLEGSQNGVFAEEAVKLLLDSKDDEKKLVRQSARWLSIKLKNFGKQE